MLSSDLLEHREVDEQVAALAKGGGHGFVERGDFDTHAVIGTVVEHRHEVTITAYEHDTINRSAIDEAHGIHTEIEVEVCLFRPTGEGFVILRGDTIA